MICKRILLQFVQTGRFSTNDPVEAYHVALMVDRNYVEAEIEKDGSGKPTSAVIGRLTACGHDAYDAEFLSQKETSVGGFRQDAYYNVLATIKSENDKGRDKVLLTISTGGIALLFAIVSFFRRAQIPFETVPWIITISLLAFVLIGLLVSYHLGSNAIDCCIAKINDSEQGLCYKYKKGFLDKVSQWLNVANCVFVIMGIGTFAWFVLASI